MLCWWHKSRFSRNAVVVKNPSELETKGLTELGKTYLCFCVDLSIPEIPFALNLRKLEDVPAQTAIRPTVVLRGL
jgi:hypothetical protein